MKKFIKYIVPSAVAVLSMGMTSCAGDLDVTPIDPNTTTSGENLGDNLLNKCYANMAVAGQGGANGDCDIDGLDGGTTGFVRQLFNAQSLTTDEAVCAWGDAGISNLNFGTCDASHPMLAGLYYRLYAGIDYCNQYLSAYAGQDEEKTSEARFLRAYYYSVLMDGWGNVPFATTISTEKPHQIKRADLYKWVISELRDVEGKLSAPTSAPKENESGYGRANKYTDQLLLSRIYLNAKVYAGVEKYDSAAYYAQEVITKSPYKLHKTAKTSNWTAYQELFMGDNGQNGATEDCLLALPQDGISTTSWGTTMFLMAGSIDKSIHIKDANTTGINLVITPWAGNRMKKDLVEKFFPNDDAPAVGAYAMPAAAKDDRAIFDAEGRNLENTATTQFTDGYATGKFNNFYTDGSTGHATDMPDCDFFLFRIAEAYLNYAEATARANNDSPTPQGIEYLNELRARAHAAQKTSYTLNDICDEWAREFYFEGYRRTTLIRFNRFAGNVNYNWAWKGGVLNGTNIDKHYNLFAIPEQDRNANSNLEQNPGY